MRYNLSKKASHDILPGALFNVNQQNSFPLEIVISVEHNGDDQCIFTYCIWQSEPVKIFFRTFDVM